MQYKNPTIIAEIGCNHKGDLNIAKKMILSAAKCGAKYVKFQKRNNKYLLGKNITYHTLYQKIHTENPTVSIENFRI